jgi:hypothetical protein
VKPLAIFLAGLVVVFGSLAAAIVLSRETQRAFVVVDSSFPMRTVWSRVPAAIATIEDDGYTQYALATEKDLIHSWQDQPRFREGRPYAPCDFSGIADYVEAAQADVRILVTTAGSCPTDGLGDWQVVLLQP